MAVAVGLAAAALWLLRSARVPEEEEEERGKPMSRAEVPEDVFLWAGEQLRHGQDVDKILALLREVSSSDKVEDLIAARCLDALVTEGVAQTHAESVLFILANAARSPSSHKFFFSGRFSFERFIDFSEAATRRELLRLMLNLTYDKFTCSLCVQRLKLMEMLDIASKDTDRQNLLLVEKIQHNVHMNEQS